MSYLQWGGFYLLVGYVIAFIFAVFFTKMLVIKFLSEESKIEIRSKKPSSFLQLFNRKLIVIFAHADDESSTINAKIIFQLKDGWLFLTSSLIWPIFLTVLIWMVLGRIFGKQLSPNGLE